MLIGNVGEGGEEMRFWEATLFSAFVNNPGLQGEVKPGATAVISVVSWSLEASPTFGSCCY